MCLAANWYPWGANLRSIGFHASKGIIRFVVLEGTRQAPTLVTHDRRPLQLSADRPLFIRNARNLFESVLTNVSPQKISYILTMNAKSKDQVAGLILPFGILNFICSERDLSCVEFIAPNFSKNFFSKYKKQWSNRYDVFDAIVGTHPPNWTDSERLAGLAALGAM